MHVSVGSTPMACFPGLKLMFVNISFSISRIIWSTICKHVDPKVLLNFKETLFPGFHGKRWSGYLHFQVNYMSILFQILCWKNNFAVVCPQVLSISKLHKMTHIPLTVKTSPFDDSLNLLKYISACREMQTCVECLLFHPCDSTCLSPSYATTFT